MEPQIKKDHHSLKFINRSKGTIKSHRLHLGNATSPAASRPSRHVKCSFRISQKLINNDTTQHKTVDNKIVEEPIYRKSGIPKYY